MEYLACPYRHPDPLIQRKRCAAAHYTAARLFAKGRRVFSPLTHNEILIDILDDALPGESWLQFDLGVLAACKKLLILKMEGWELSKGVQREMLFAQERGLPIEELDPPEETLYLRFLRSDGMASHTRSGG